jgi:Protein of unknown function (DUF2971)
MGSHCLLLRKERAQGWPTMTDEEIQNLEIQKLFEPLFADLKQNAAFAHERPLLAHYTTIAVLESILKKDQIWFSNPLFMNDKEEVVYGVNTGANFFLTSPEIRAACKTTERYLALIQSFRAYYADFFYKHILEMYVLCFSKHQPENNDGLLSMWRAYGGNGNGAAIVLDTAKLSQRQESPLIIDKVHYGTAEKRNQFLKEKVLLFAKIVSEADILDEKLWIGAHVFFERIKLFGVFTKHIGFEEEQEWRVVYMRERDQDKAFEDMFSYLLGSRGAEPRLKLQINKIPDLALNNLKFSDLVDRIILGPSVSSPLARSAVEKMLAEIKKPELKERIIASSIPLRGPF